MAEVTTIWNRATGARVWVSEEDDPHEAIGEALSAGVLLPRYVQIDCKDGVERYFEVEEQRARSRLPS